MNYRRGTIPFVYLGLPIGGDPRKLSFWKPVVDSIVSRLSSWNHRFLSFGRRLVLLKSVMSSLSVHFLSSFKAPRGIISSIESIFNFFFFGGGGLREGGSHCSAWWRSLRRVRQGIGEGVGSWFENNTRRVVGDGWGTFFWYDIWVGEIPLKLKFP